MNLKSLKTFRRVPVLDVSWLAQRVIPLLLAGMCGCESVTYDMHHLHQPVVLNGNPFIEAEGVTAPKLSQVDRYEAEVNYFNVAASGGGYTSSQVGQNNNAQTMAFAKIGGQSNRAICNLTVEADYQAINALIALGTKVSIKVKGDVGEFPVAPKTNNPALVKIVTVPSAPDAATNRSAILSSSPTTNTPAATIQNTP